MLKIIDTDYLNDLKIRLTFSDGKIKIFDGNDLEGSVYNSIKNPSAFVCFGLEHGTLVWMDGNYEIDASPEYLYEISKEEN